MATLKDNLQATNAAGTTYTLQALKGNPGKYRVNAVTADGTKKVVVNRGVPLEDALRKTQDAAIFDQIDRLSAEEIARLNEQAGRTDVEEAPSEPERQATRKELSEEARNNRAKAEHALKNEGIDEIEDASGAVKYRIIEQEGGYFVQATFAWEGKGTLHQNMVREWGPKNLQASQGYNQNWTREQAVEALLNTADFEDHRAEWREKERSREVFVERLERGESAPAYRNVGGYSFAVVQTGKATFEVHKQQAKDLRRHRRVTYELVGKYRTKRAAIDAAVAQVPRFAEKRTDDGAKRAAGDSSPAARNDRQEESGEKQQAATEQERDREEFIAQLRATGPHRASAWANGLKYLINRTEDEYHVNSISNFGDINYAALGSGKSVFNSFDDAVQALADKLFPVKEAKAAQPAPKKEKRKKEEKKEKGIADKLGEHIGGSRADTAEKRKAGDGLPEWAGGYTLRQVEDEEGDGKRYALFFNGADIRGRFSTVEQAVEHLRDRVADENFWVSGRAKDYSYGVVYKIAARKKRNGRTGFFVEAPEFATEKEAADYLRANLARLMAGREEKLKEMRGPAKPRKKGYGERDLLTAEVTVRVGAERRTGDAKPEDFMQAFGFRGVEFGLWNKQSERQTLLNDAYDALMDLADLLDIPPRALSLNGELALAFGARGRGGNARAHYEPDKVVINLTKTSGVGTLAHEWLHALDWYFGSRGGDKRKSMSERANRDYPLENVRQEVVNAFRNLQTTVLYKKTPRGYTTSSDYYREAKRFSSKYWQREWEMMARAFTAYIEDMLAERGEKSTFLSYGSDNAAYAEWGLKPFPEGEQRQAINRAFKEFFDTLEVDDSEGRAALYSIEDDGPTRANGRPARREGEDMPDYNRRVKAWNDRRKAEVKAAVDMVKRLVPGLTVKNVGAKDLDGEIGKLKGQVRHLKNANGLVIGAYHPGSKTVLLTHDADTSTVLHEIGWHAVYDWAKTNAPELYRQMRDYALQAPKEVRDWIRSRYGSFTPDGILDEIGAKLFTEQGRADFEKAVQDRAARTWYQRMADLFRDLWNRFTGAHRADLGAYRGMEPEAAMKRLLADITGGKRFESGVRAFQRTAGNAVESGVGQGDMVVRFAKALGVSPEQLQAEYDAVVAQYKDTPQWRKAPNGEDSKLNERQWVLVRTPRFKNWFGDWEVLNAYNFATGGEPVARLTGQEFQKDGVPLTQKVPDFYRTKYGGVVANPELGEVKIDTEGVKDSLGHGVGSLKSAAFAAVPEIIQNGVVFNRETNWKGRGYDTAVIVAPITIGGENYVGEVVVKRGSQRQGFYLHEVEISKGLEKAFKTATGSAPQARTSRLILSSKLGEVKNCSQVVDENGEPRVVYHGSDWNPLAEAEGRAAFDAGRAGENTDAGFYGRGFYFATNATDAKQYGEHVTEAFLNIKNPYRADQFGKTVEGTLPFPMERFGFPEGYTLKDFVRELEAEAESIPEIKYVEAGKFGNGSPSYEAYYVNADGNAVTVARNIGEAAMREARQNGSAAYRNRAAHEALRAKYPDADIRSQYLMRDFPPGEISAMIRAEGHDGVIGDGTNLGDVGQEIVAFSSTQIKSATDNSGAFDPNDDDIRYQFLGEQGAAALDAAEEATTRLDNLAVARSMEQAGKDAKAVKLATGWERGKDGKWRYEIDDSGNRVDLAAWKKSAPTLGNLLNAPELFKAYPALKYAKVEFRSVPAESGWLGGYKRDLYNGQRIFVLNQALQSSNDVLRIVLHHEIQHAIQEIEGFAKGGSAGQFAKTDKQAAMEHWAAFLEGFVKEGYEDETGSPYTYETAARDNLKWAKEDKSFSAADIEAFEAIVSAKNVEETVKRLAAASREAGAEAQYERLAGEVEARNVQRRLDMTPEERRASLASETEDVAREDQIVLQEMLGQAASAENSPSPASPDSPLKEGALKASLSEGGGRAAAGGSDAKLSVAAVPVGDRADIEAELAQGIGKTWANKILRAKNGNVRIVETQEEARRMVGANNETVKRSESGTIQGFYLNGVAYLVRDGIAKGNVMGVLMHEYGEHAAQLGFADNVGYRAILASIKNRQNENSETGKAIQAAMARVPEGTPEEHYWNEVVAYLVEANANIKTTALDRITHFFKKWLHKITGLGADNFTHKDLVLFARAAVKAAGRAKARGSAESFDSRGETLQPAFMSMKDTKERMIAAAAEQMGVPLEQLQAEYEAVAKRHEGQPRNAPNGEASKLTEEQWILARTPSFLRKYGNWAYNPDASVEPVDLSGVTEISHFTEMKQLREWVKARYIGQNVTIDSDGAIVGFTVRGLKDSLKRGTAEKWAAYAKLDELIRGSRYFDFEVNDGLPKHKHLDGQDIYYSAMKIGEKVYSVRFKLDIAKSDATRIYKDHKVVDIKISPAVNAGEAQQGSAPPRSGEGDHSSLVYHAQAQNDSGSPSHAGTEDVLPVTLGDLTGGVKPGNVSIPLDANGEPTADAFPSTTDDGGGPNGGQSSGGPLFSIAAPSSPAPNPANNNAVTGQSFIDRILANAAPKWRDRWERFIYNFLDSNDPRERVWKRAGAPSDKDFVTIERLRGKKAAAEQKRFKREMLDPLLDTLGKAGLSVSDLEEYAHALHTPERNQRMREVNAKRNLDEAAKNLGEEERRNLKSQMEFISTQGKQAGWTESDIQKAYLDLLNDIFTGGIRVWEVTQRQAERALSPNSSQAEINRVAKGRERLEALKKHRDKWQEESVRFAGMTDAEAASIIQKWQGDNRYAALQKAQRQLAAINAATLDVLHEAGELGDEEYQAMKNGYAFYVPLHRDGFQDTRPPAVGRSTGPVGSPFKVAKGSMRAVVNILANSVQAHETAINRRHKLEAGRALYEFAQAHPDAGITVERQEKKPTHDKEGNITMYTSQAEPEDGVFVKVDGVKYLLRFNTDNSTPEGRTLARFLDSVKGADAQLGGLVRMLHTATRWLAAVNTSFSPEFVVTNFSRDFQTAFIHLNQKGIDMDGLKRAVAKDVFPAMKGIFAAERGNRNGAMARWYADYEANGGKVGWMQSYETIGDLAKEIQNELKLRQKGHHILKTGVKMKRLVEHANAAIENCMRLATYKALVERGVSRQKAAMVASSLTVDFTQRGKMSPQINALYMFFNASVQGSVRMVQALATSRKVQAIAGGIAGAGFVLQMLALAGGGDDDSGEPNIFGIPESTRERNIIIMIPGSDGKRYIKIPKAYGYGALYDFGAELANSIYMSANGRKYDHAKGAMRVVSSFANSFNPIQSATLLQALSPTLLDPVVYVAENKSWAGTPLMPEQSPYGPSKPDSERAWKGTSPIFKKLAKALNDMTGGDTYQGGWADISPETFSMAWDTATGGLGRFVGNVVALPFTAASGETEARRVPFLRQVYGEWNDRAITSRYYEAMDRAEIAHMRFKNAESLAERKRLYQEPDHKLYLQSRLAEKQIKALRKRQQLMEAAGDKDGAERLRQRIVEKQAEVLKQAA